MNKITFRSITFVLSFTLMSIVGFAQDNETTTTKTTYSIEIDPATFAFGGYGVHLRIKPKNSNHLLIGVGTYAMDMPSLIVDFNEKNKAQGWHARLNNAIALFGEYHFSEVNKKWFTGLQISGQEYKMQKDFYESETKFTNGLLLAYGGYTWQPFDFNLYLKPWLGFGYTTKLSGENKISDAEYDIAPILIFSALHIGYTF